VSTPIICRPQSNDSSGGCDQASSASPPLARVPAGGEGCLEQRSSSRCTSVCRACRSSRACLEDCRPARHSLSLPSLPALETPRPHETSACFALLCRSLARLGYPPRVRRACTACARTPPSHQGWSPRPVARGAMGLGVSPGSGMTRHAPRARSGVTLRDRVQLSNQPIDVLSWAGTPVHTWQLLA
jgi:hypothetical protein